MIDGPRLQGLCCRAQLIALSRPLLLYLSPSFHLAPAAPVPVGKRGAHAARLCRHIPQSEGLRVSLTGPPVAG